MKTVETRELEQNPQSVIRCVLETGEEIEVTAYGEPTGIHLSTTPKNPRSRWVSGATLNNVPPLAGDDTQELLTDLEY